MTRLTVSAASMVCNVEITRWPVSAAISAALTVGVAAEPAEPREGVGEVRLAGLGELPGGALVHQRERRTLGAVRSEGRKLGAVQDAVDPDDRRGAGLDVQVGPAPLHELPTALPH